MIAPAGTPLLLTTLSVTDTPGTGTPLVVAWTTTVHHVADRDVRRRLW